MVTKARHIPAGRFKNTCLALLDDVAATGEEVVVTKRGKAIAKVVPISAPRPLEGSVLGWDVDDGPAISPKDWNITR